MSDQAVEAFVLPPSVADFGDDARLVLSWIGRDWVDSAVFDGRARHHVKMLGSRAPMFMTWGPQPSAEALVIYMLAPVSRAIAVLKAFERAEMIEKQVVDGRIQYRRKSR